MALWKTFGKLQAGHWCFYIACDHCIAPPHVIIIQKLVSITVQRRVSQLWEKRKAIGVWLVNLAFTLLLLPVLSISLISQSGPSRCSQHSTFFHPSQNSSLQKGRHATLPHIMISLHRTSSSSASCNATAAKEKIPPHPLYLYPSHHFMLRLSFITWHHQSRATGSWKLADFSQQKQIRRWFRQNKKYTQGKQ